MVRMPEREKAERSPAEALLCPSVAFGGGGAEGDGSGKKYKKCHGK